MHQQWQDYRVFWRQFREAYQSTGAVLPSGRALARALSRYVREPGEAALAAGTNGALASQGDRHLGRRILEVGPGTGAVTAQIVQDMGPDDRLDLVERNDQFVAHLGQRIAAAEPFKPAAARISLLHAAVEDLPDDPQYDLIISGLPLNNFAVHTVENILAKLRRLLASGGTLSFFEYVAVRRAKALVSSPAERQRLRGIGRFLGDVLQTAEVRRDVVLANVPPAWVHHVRYGDWGLGTRDCGRQAGTFVQS
jgi:phosphatidylethanolamine/phosphatidyl-N-methylethanolamine N-methyltransferase